MRRKWPRACLSIVERTMGKIKYWYIPSGRRRIVGRKAGTGETLGGLVCVGPARDGGVLRVGASTAGPKNGLVVGRDKYVARNRYSNRGQDSI
jgi:hypothetical protein